MTINADKSMDFIMIEAIDQSLFESEEFQETTNEKMIEKLKRAGFQIENYYEEGKRGYQITKHFKNIDDVSTREELVADLGLENLAEVGMLFQVKPGFLKNQYQAKFTTQEQNLLIGDAQTENTEDDFSDLKEQLEGITNTTGINTMEDFETVIRNGNLNVSQIVDAGAFNYRCKMEDQGFWVGDEDYAFNYNFLFGIVIGIIFLYCNL